MDSGREDLLRLLKADLAIMKEGAGKYSTEIFRVNWAIQILPEAPESQVRSFRRALDRRHQEGELGIGMMEELTTEMHDEFDTDDATD